MQQDDALSEPMSNLTAAAAPPADTEAGALVGWTLVDVNVLLTVVYLAIFLIGVVGNVCNCLVIADSRNKYMKTATNYYLFSLSVSDLLLLIFGLPHDLVNLWHPAPYLFNQFVCLSRGWISEAATNASVLVIVAFTVERYLAICHPLRAHTLSRLSRSVKIIVGIWLVASSCALLVVMQYGVITIEEARADGQRVPTAQCTIVQSNESVFELSVFILFIVPMVVITILYVKLGLHLRAKTKQIRANQLKRQRRLLSQDADSQLSNTNHSTTGEAAGAGLAPPPSRPPAGPAPAPSRWAWRGRPRVPAISLDKSPSLPDVEAGGVAQPMGVVKCDNGRGHVWSGSAADLGARPERQARALLQASSANALAKSTSAPTDGGGGGSNRSLSGQAPGDRGSRPSNCELPAPITLNSTVNTANMQNVIKMLVSVVVMFFICWAPFHAQRLMAVYVTEPTSQQEFIYRILNHISGISYYISAVVNPILYRVLRIFKANEGILGRNLPFVL